MRRTFYNPCPRLRKLPVYEIDGAPWYSAEDVRGALHTTDTSMRFIPSGHKICVNSGRDWKFKRKIWLIDRDGVYAMLIKYAMFPVSACMAALDQREEPR